MRSLLVILASLAVILLAALIPAPADKVTFLDIGQGDSILLQQGTAQVLIDGGAGNTVLTRLGEELPYFDRTIEVVIATHPDKDHLEGLLHVLEKYQVSLVVLPHVPHTSQLQAEWLSRLQEAVEEKKIAYRFAVAGQQITTGPLQLIVLNPVSEASATTSKTNNASVITRVDFSDLSLLLSGDAEVAVERDLVSRVDPALLDVGVLKAGHHGSQTSTSQELLDATTPQLVAISVGKDNSYGHPHPAIVARLAAAHIPVIRTDEVGSIRFTHDGLQWLLACGHQSLFPSQPKSCMKET